MPPRVASPSLAFWFIALTLVTMWGTLGSIAHSGLLFAVLAALTGGSAVTAAGLWAGSLATLRAGGWFFVVSAGLAWLAGGAMTLEHSFGRTVIPLFKWSKAANVPGRSATRPISYPAGMPGVRVGQQGIRLAPAGRGPGGSRGAGHREVTSMNDRGGTRSTPGTEYLGFAASGRHGAT